jgi:parvulin-like peptidyl-prolyl isomerase
MKQYFRAPFSSLVLATLFLLSPTSGWAKRQVLDRSVITVNDDIILESDIEAFRQKAKQKNFQELFGGMDASKLENRDAVLQLLVEEKLIDQAVKKLELTASDQEVDRHIRTIVERNGITEVQLKSRLKDLGTSYQEYRDGIRRQLERRNLVDREIKPMMEVSEEELRHFLMRNGGASDPGHRYQLAHIMITTKGKAGEARAQHILKEAIAKPDEFAKLAKEYSDDKGTASTGGDLGMLSLDAMGAEFRDAAKQTPTGKVFPKVVKSKGGMHILKVLGSQALSFADLPEDKKSELRNQLMSQELEKKMASWLERKKNEAHIRRSESKEPTSGS